MIHRSIIRVSALLVALVGCRGSDPKRDKIIFEDDVQSVKDSMTVIVQFMANLEHATGVNNYLFGLNGDFIIGDRNLGSLANVYHDTLLSRLGQSTLHRFTSLVLFLNRNQIDGCIHDASLAHWVFGYRGTLIADRTEDRMLFLLSSNEKAKDYDGILTLLDVQHGVALFRPQ